MRMMRFVMLAMTMLCAATREAAAQQAEEESLGTVVVTATRTQVPLEAVTSSVSVVGQDELQARQPSTVTDALRDVPGVDVAQNGSLGNNASVFIRGANSDQTLVLFDGVEVNSPTLGGFNFGNITTTGVGRIEVLRGAGGTLYGSDAIGGVVNVISQAGEGKPQFSVASGGGNIGTAYEAATAAGRSGIVAYSAALGYLTTAGFRQVNDDFSDLTSAARVDVSLLDHGTLRGFWRSAHSSLGLADNNIGNGLGTLLDPDARERDEFYLTKLEWEHTILEHLTYRIAGAYTRTVNVTSDTVSPQEATIGALPTYFRVPNETSIGEAQVNYAEGTVGLSSAGFEFKEQSGTYKFIFNDVATRFSHSRANYAGYAQQQIFLFDNTLTGVGGFRVDGNQDFGDEVSASWSLGYLQDWHSNGKWTTHLRGGYAEGFKAPTFNQLFVPQFGNPNLDPEISSEYDAGFDQHLGLPWLAIDTTYFTRRTRNLIQSAQTAPFVFVTANAARADVSGPEASVVIGPVYGISLRGTYTYLDWQVIENPGLTLEPAQKTLERRPHNAMSTLLSYAGDAVLRPADHVDAAVNMLFVGERHDLDPLTFQDVSNQPAYTRADLAINYDTPMPGADGLRIGGFARLQNAFDRNYDEVRGFKAPPINVLAGARLAF